MFKLPNQDQRGKIMGLQLEGPPLPVRPVDHKELNPVYQPQPAGPAENKLLQRAGGKRISKIYTVIGLVALGVGAFGLRFMTNGNHTAYMDEVSQILGGRYLIEQGLVYAAILKWSYGSYLWPLVAGSMDIIGGLSMVRAFTALCGVVMTLATFVLAYRLTDYLPGRQRQAVAFVAGLIMATFPTSLGIGQFGTYDALAGAAFMTGIALLFPVEGRARRTRLLASCVLLFVAFLAKYVIAIYFPVVCLYLIFSAGSIRNSIQRLTWLVGPLAAGCAIYFLIFRSDLLTLLSFSQTYTDLKSNDPFLVYVWQRPELWLLAAIASFGWHYATRQNKVISAGGAGVIMAFQAITRPDYDFWKHSIYLIFFLAPLAALALVIPAARVVTRPAGSGIIARSRVRFRMIGLSALAVVVFSVSVALSLSQAYLLVNFYPNLSTALPAIRQNSVGAQTVLTDDVALRYYLYPHISPDQVTDPFYIEYKGLSGMAAYRQSITDRHYDLIILDGGIGPIGQQISKNLTGLIKNYYDQVSTQSGPNGTTVSIYKPLQCLVTPPAANSKVFDFNTGLKDWGGHSSQGDFQEGNLVSLSQEQTCGGQTSLKFTPSPQVKQVAIRLVQPVKTVKAQVYIENDPGFSGESVIGMAGFDQKWQWHDNGFNQFVPPGRWTEITWQLAQPGIYNELDLVFPKETKTVYISHFEVEP